MSEIAFIGGGNMASAIIGGLIAGGKDPVEITVVDPSADKRFRLTADFNVNVTDSATVAFARADTIILAVKPQIISLIAEQVVGAVDLSHKFLVSIAAGVTLSTLEALFGPIAIARSMPNTPALVGLGASGLFVNAYTSQTQHQEAERILRSFGICVTVAEEGLLDAVTAVSGSGPAYYFLMIEEMTKAGVALGLTQQDARALTLQTALGAATMAAKGDVEAQELRRRVTSPGGTTNAAITCMKKQDFGELVKKALIAARDRAVELGET